MIVDPNPNPKPNKLKYVSSQRIKPFCRQRLFVSLSVLFISSAQLFDGEGRGRVSAEELSGLMGALLGFPQRNTAQLFREVSAHGPVTAGETFIKY